MSTPSAKRQHEEQIDAAAAASPNDDTLLIVLDVEGTPYLYPIKLHNLGDDEAQWRRLLQSEPLEPGQHVVYEHLGKDHTETDALFHRFVRDAGWDGHKKAVVHTHISGRMYCGPTIGTVCLELNYDDNDDDDDDQ
jgi:hypothetical protein